MIACLVMFSFASLISLLLKESNKYYYKRLERRHKALLVEHREGKVKQNILFPSKNSDATLRKE
jgi:hypothetical protein